MLKKKKKKIIQSSRRNLYYNISLIIFVQFVQQPLDISEICTIVVVTINQDTHCVFLWLISSSLFELQTKKTFC